MCDDTDDNATIYVRERGQLRRVNNGIVLAETESVPVTSCSRTNPLMLRKEHFVFTYNAEGSLRYSAKSLFDISLLFIADNIHHVESLVGFPEQIGEQLFAAAEEKHVFLNSDTAPRALQVFSEAYGEMMLASLCLRNRFPLLSEKINEIKTFHSLKRLDLFGCRLGDSHEIFQHLTSNSSASLIQLFIGGNCMTDVGIQRFTAPIRILKKGLNNLQLLDLSYNPISERAVGYLTCLPKLQKLDLSGTRFKLGTVLKKTIWDLMGLVHSEKPLNMFDHSTCKTEGWAEQVVNQWEKNATQMPKQRKIEDSRTSALRFFGRQKFFRGVLGAKPLVQETGENDKKEVLHFHKPAAHHCTLDHIQLPGTFHNNVKKRKRPSENSGHQYNIPAEKHISSSALTVEDLDLLNSY